MKGKEQYDIHFAVGKLGRVALKSPLSHPVLASVCGFPGNGAATCANCSVCVALGA